MVNNTAKLAAIFGCRAILTCASIALTITLFLPMLLADSYSWLHSDNAINVLKSYIEQQAKEQGYILNVKGLDYNLPEGRISIDNMDVHYASRKLLQMRGIEIDVSIGELVSWDVNVGATIGELIFENQTSSSMPYVLNNISTDVRANFADVISGAAKAKALYKNRQIAISTNFLIEEDLLKASNVVMSAPDFQGSGAVAVLLSNNLMRGGISGQLDELSFYEHLVGVGHELHDTDFNVTFSPVVGKQSILVDVRAKSYESKEYLISMNDIGLNASLVGAKLNIDSLRAINAEGGEIRVSGDYDLANGVVDISLKANDFYISHMDIAKGIVSADLSFKGKGTYYLLSGDVLVDNMNIKLPNNFSQSVAELNIQTVSSHSDNKPQDAMQDITLDVDVDAPKQIFVRGWGLDAEFGGKVKAHGSLSNPEFDGAIDLKRGRYEAFGKKFKIFKARLNFSGTIPPSPKFDLLAETKTGEITAQVGIKGNVLSPVIEFYSIPPLPEDEVLAHILFGEGVENISPFQAVKLAQTLQKFTGHGGGVSAFDPVELLRTTAGFDELRFDTDQNGNASVGAGKHLSDKVYVEVEAGSGTGSGQANIEIELTPHITLESQIGQNAQGGAGIFWKWDY